MNAAYYINYISYYMKLGTPEFQNHKLDLVISFLDILTTQVRYFTAEFVLWGFQCVTVSYNNDIYLK